MNFKLIIFIFSIIYLKNFLCCDFEENKELNNFSGRPHISAYQRRQLKKLRLKDKKDKEEAKYIFQEISAFRFDKLSLYSLAWSHDINKMFCLVAYDSKQYELLCLDPFTKKLEFRKAISFWGYPKIELSLNERKACLGGKGYRKLFIYDLDSNLIMDFVTPNEQYAICSTAWSPCNAKVAANFHGLVLIYDVKSKEIIHTFHFPNSIGVMSWSSDGSKLLFNLCDAENSVGLLDIEAGNYDILYEHDIKEDNYTSTGPRVNQFVWLFDTIFAACSNYKIVFWDIEKGQKLKLFYTQTSERKAISFFNNIPAHFASDDAPLTYLSPNGRFLALLHPGHRGAYPEKFSIIDIKNRKIIEKDLNFLNSFGRFDEIKCVEWSHDSNFLAVCNKYGDIKIWEIVKAS